MAYMLTTLFLINTFFKTKIMQQKIANQEKSLGNISFLLPFAVILALTIQNMHRYLKKVIKTNATKTRKQKALQELQN